MGDINAFDFLREEMDQDEIQYRVNAIHRLKIVAEFMTTEQIKTQLLPYIDSNSCTLFKYFYLFFNLIRFNKEGRR